MNEPEEPVSPEVAYRGAELPSHAIRTINKFLSEPWSERERISGRTMELNALDQVQREQVIKLYQAKGWHVTQESDPVRPEQWLCFRPQK